MWCLTQDLSVVINQGRLHAPAASPTSVPHKQNASKGSVHLRVSPTVSSFCDCPSIIHEQKCQSKRWDNMIKKSASDHYHVSLWKTTAFNQRKENPFLRFQQLLLRLNINLSNFLAPTSSLPSTSLSSLQPQAELFSFSPEKKLGYFPAVKVLRPSSGPLHSWC